MRKLIILIVLLIFPLSIAFAFTDTNSSQHKQAIEYLRDNGVVQGYDDRTYRPFNSVNRAEFIKILIEAKSPRIATETGQTNCFPDVSNQWFAPYICYAKTLGIIDGYPDNLFRPENAINLAEALKVVLETYKVEVDHSLSSNWYGGYFTKANENQWLENIDMNVNHFLSRGEMAQFIYAINITDLKAVPKATPTNLLNPSPNLGETCHENSFNMAFILLVENRSDGTNELTQLLSNIMTGFENSFGSATQNLAQMNTEGPFIIEITNDMIDDFGLLDTQILTKEFYKQHPDNYEFISIYPTFSTNEMIPMAGAATHATPKNKIKGIGMEIFDYTDLYGSSGRLLGVNMMTNINGTLHDSISSSNILLHETGHQWCCYVGDNFSRGTDGDVLEILQNNIHFYRGLNSPNDTGSPLNSDYWVTNNDGTYKRTFNYEESFKYHPFTLYFMGLLSESEYSKNYTVYDAGIMPNWNFEKATPYKNVSINDIIKVMGERTCSN